MSTKREESRKKFAALNERRKNYKKAAELIRTPKGRLVNSFEIGREARSAIGGAFGEGYFYLNGMKTNIPKEMKKIVGMGLS